MTEPKTRRSRRPDRDSAERDLMQAAIRLLERDGVLVGLNMQEIADEAGLNRGLIHHYFGSRRNLLRAAIAREIATAGPVHAAWRSSDPVKKRRAHFREMVRRPEVARMVALLALDGDEDLQPIPYHADRLEDMAREQAEGAIPDDVDLEASLVMWEAFVIGYVIIRESVSRQLDMSQATLDKRVLNAATSHF